MSRINTNVSSLIAQHTLARNEADLQTSLARLSTGLRINVGKDDPAGLIASEALRSDISSIEKSVGNSERANQMIATADSAIGQVSGLLNDIRGLVVEAANTGAMSSDQIAANQLQVDSSIEAINRIAQTTTFQGRRLLDGSLDFTTSVAAVSSVTNAQIDMANLGAAGSAAVDVDISAAATQAAITNSAGFTSSANASATLSFAAGAAFDNADGDAHFWINATELGASHSGTVISFVHNGTATGVTAAYDDAAGTLVITLDNTAGETAQDVVDAINAESTGIWAATVTGSASGAIDAGDTGVTTDTTGIDSLKFDAVAAGADYNGVAVSITSTSAATGAVWDATQKTITVNVINTGGPVLLSTIETAVDSDLSGVFTSTATGSGDTYFGGATDDVNAVANTDTTGGNVLNDEVVFSIGGLTGREVFNFEAGASVNQISDAINLVSDSTGVTTSQSAGTLTLNSTEYGSKGVVDIEIISEGTTGTFGNGLSATRSTGTDVVATVNGISASGDGNTLSVNTAYLDMSVTVSDGSSTNFDFTISGGGALFQLGPDVVTNQQARIGLQALNAAKLGGSTGRLYELTSGAAKDLTTDPNSAFKVVDEAISEVSSLRGRLGAFQRLTLDTNIASLNETLVNLTAAESAIRDADFAKETAALTRAQILVQSSTSVLGIANSNPQNVLSLLR